MPSPEFRGVVAEAPRLPLGLAGSFSGSPGSFLAGRGTTEIPTEKKKKKKNRPHTSKGSGIRGSSTVLGFDFGFKAKLNPPC